MARSIKDALEQYPRISLTRLPTPLHSLPHLSERLGVNVFIKRDDLTDLTLGGDKPRKLEYEIAQAAALFAYSEKIKEHLIQRGVALL